MARVSWASLLIEPKDIAPVLKRLTISVGRLDLVERDRRIAGLRIEQPAQRAMLRFSSLTSSREFLEQARSGLAAHRVLQLGDGLRVAHVVLAVAAPLVVPAESSRGASDVDPCRIGVAVAPADFAAITSMPMPPMREAVPVKYRSMTASAQADGLEDLRAAVALHGRDAHLRHDLQHALFEP